MKRYQTSRDWLAAGGPYARQISPLALALFVSVLALAPRNALAGCGDYVMVRGVMVGNPHHDGLPGALHSTPGNSGGIPSCSGPRCQRHVPLRPAPEEIVSTSGQDTACPVAPTQLHLLGHHSLLSEPSLLVSQAILSPPDHPPRRSV